KREVMQRQRAESALMESQRASYQANIYVAYASLGARDTVDAERALNACEPSLRNWEWNHLHYKLDSSTLTIEAGGVSRSSPDGRWIAAALVDGDVKVWNAETGA